MKLVDQKKLVENGIVEQQLVGSNWYLIALPWYQLWAKYVSYPDEFSYPGPIDNSSIVDSKGDLLPSMDERNYMAVPESAWKELDRHYTIYGKAPKPIVRQVVINSNNNNRELEIYPYKVVLCLVNEDDSILVTPVTLSRYLTLDKVCERLPQSRGWSLGPSKKRAVDLWLKQKSSNKIRLLQYPLSTTLEKLDISDGSLLIVKRSNELPKPNLALVKEVLEAFGAETVSIVNSYSSSSESKINTENRPSRVNETAKIPKYANGTAPGLCGLDNLGNTCFMNTVIQAISHLPELRDFFIKGHYMSSAKQKTVLCDNYADLMKSLWLGSNETACPENFREVFMRLVPSLSDGQQDASSFLESLLSYLNEEMKYSRSQGANISSIPLEEDAKRHWFLYKRSNPSLVSDLFDGQLKSTLRCEVCHNVLTSYDSFTCLSLPLPSFQPLTVYFRHANPSKQVEVTTMMLPRKCSISDVRSNAAHIFKVDPLSFFIGKMTLDFRFQEFYADSDIPRFGDKKLIICFEFVQSKQTRPESRSSHTKCIVYLASGKAISLEGFPYLLIVPRDSSTEMSLAQQVYQLIEPYFVSTRIPMEGEDYNLILINTDFSGERIELDGSNNRRLVDLYNQQPKAVIMRWDTVRFSKMFQKSTFEAIVSPRSQWNGEESVLLVDCLKSYLEEELLHGSDAWECPKCNNERRPAYKKMDITMLPPYLTFHLNRFKHDDWGSNKMETVVKYDLKNFDMRPFVAQSCAEDCLLYDLEAVICHYGDITGGHYKVFIWRTDLDKWFQFDDRYVEEIPESDVMNKKDAFMLFYRKRSISKESLV